MEPQVSGGALPDRTLPDRAEILPPCQGWSRARSCLWQRANACFLATHGFEVDAVDISEDGLQRFVCRSPAINRICQNLESYRILPRRYQLIINTRFLMRHLFPALQDGLLPGGVLIFETYLQEASVAAGKRFGRNHLLRDNELRHAFPALQTIAYAESPSRHKDAPARKASLIAVRPSVV